MSHTTKDAARSLAVCYSAYMEATHSGSHLGRMVWGRELLHAQRDAGVELFEEGDLQESINSAEWMDKQERLEIGRERRAELSL